MKYTILTSMNRAILDQTGRSMLCSLTRWPRDVDIAVAFEGDYVEVGNFRDEFCGVGVDCIDLLDRDRDLRSWMRKYRHYPGQDAYRYCAWRFAFKSFAVTGVGRSIDTDVLIWLDADTYTFRELPEIKLSGWLPEGKLVSYLGRVGSASECGFVMYDMRAPEIDTMLDEWREVYTSGRIFKFREWHDCYIFDWARLKCLTEDDWHNLSPWGVKFQHVFINSPIGAYMDHMKGRRKGGKSRERDTIPAHVSPHFIKYLRE